MTMIKVIQSVGAVTGFAAVFLLYWGSLGVPHKIQSWKGETAAEQAWESRQRIMVRTGIPCAIIAFICQIISIFIN